MVKMMHGDCINEMACIPDKYVNMVLADLPFGTTKNEWDIPVDLPKWWAQIKRVTKPGAAIVLFAQVPFNIKLGASNLDWLRYEWIYKKTLPTGHLNANRMPMKAHENVMVFYDKLPTYNPIKTTGHPRKKATRTLQSSNYGFDKGSTYDSTDRFPLSVQEFKSDRQKSCENSTQKPVKMLEFFIQTYTKAGDVVLDTCAGFGSTGVAAENIGRDSILIEKSIIMFDKMYNRINAPAGDKRI